VLKEKIGVEVALFAYPYGEYDPAVQALVQRLGFVAACGQQSGVVSPYADLFALPRFPMGGAYATLSGFRSKLTMRPLPVQEVVSPASSVLGAENPPTLILTVDRSVIDPARLTCYVDGRPTGIIREEPLASGRLIVTAEAPLKGRRTKYTLTAPGRKGGWYWFSQLWVQPKRSSTSD
ncbi:MAG: hypothetical protein C0621_03190, partial [Desulfuromonas sp.]